MVCGRLYAADALTITVPTSSTATTTISKSSSTQPGKGDTGIHQTTTNLYLGLINIHGTFMENRASDKCC